jgi:hypothetical protein
MRKKQVRAVVAPKSFQAHERFVAAQAPELAGTFETTFEVATTMSLAGP